MDWEKNRWPTIKALFGLVWLVGLVLAYYLTHKPLTPQLALNLTGLAWQALVAAVTLSLAGGSGRRLLGPLSLNPLVALALQAALGFGLLSLVLLLIGWLGGYHPLVVGAVWLVLLFLLRRETRSWWSSWRSLASLWRAGGRFGRLLSVGMLLIFACAFLIACSPALSFDALVYHLALPRAYIEAGRLSYVSENMFWGMPQMGEMIYTGAMLLAGDRAALLCGWCFGLVATVGLLGWMQDYFTERITLVGGASLLAGFTFASALSWGYIDWLVILFGFCALTTIDLWRRTRQPAHLLLAGIYTGFGMGAKYTAGVLLISGCLALILLSYRQVPPKQTVKTVALYSLSALLVFSPWLLKNGLATGNPVYPLLFPSGAMTPLRLALYQGGEPWGGWQDVFLLPWRATVYGVQGAYGYNSSIGPLLLGLGGLAWIGWSAFSPNQRDLLRFVVWIAVASLVIWMVAGRFSAYLLQSRLYFVVFPVFVVLAGAGYAGLRGLYLPGVRIGRIVEALVLLVFGFTVFELGVETIRRGAIPTVLATQDQNAYLETNLGWLAPAMRAVNDLPEEARVIMLWEPRNLYCLPKCDPDEVLDHWATARYGGGTSSPQPVDAILASWKELGYTHLLFHRAGAQFVRAEGGFLRQEDWSALDSLLNHLAVAQQFGDAFTLYALEP